MAKTRLTMEALLRVPLFPYLTLDESRELYRMGGQRNVGRREVILCDGERSENLYFIVSGVVKIYRLGEDGEEEVFTYLKQGDMLPLTGAMKSDKYPLNAVGVVQTVLLSLPIKHMETYMKDNPDASEKIIRGMVEKVSQQQRDMQKLSGQNPAQRGQLFLLKLAEHYGKASSGKLRIGIPMTSGDFAYTLGTTKASANRFLGQLHEEGIADMKRNAFIIHDLEALRRWRGQDA